MDGKSFTNFSIEDILRDKNERLTPENPQNSDCKPTVGDNNTLINTMNKHEVFQPNSVNRTESEADFLGSDEAINAEGWKETPTCDNRASSSSSMVDIVTEGRKETPTCDDRASSSRKVDTSPTVTNTTTVKGYQCHVCGKRFLWKSQLKQHAQLHSEEKHMCTMCGKQFALKATYTRHLHTHQGVTMYSCEVCGRRFAYYSGLYNHALTHERGEHICEVCGKRFPRKNSLTRHKTLHSGIKNYKCKVCCKQFTRTDALQRHSVIHTGGT